jgi:hypothetical protein
VLVPTNKSKFGMWMLENVTLPWSITQTRQEYSLTLFFHIIWTVNQARFICYLGMHSLGYYNCSCIGADLSAYQCPQPKDDQAHCMHMYAARHAVEPFKDQRASD